jgi:lipoprotein-anchoring transpeptidase ErfK/SrfK
LNYGPRPQEEFPLPAIDPRVLAPEFRRQRVAYRTDEEPGTVVVDTSSFYLYLVEPSGTAMRYGVGLGRQGFEWSGRARIAWKRPWPTWTPPDEMIARQPELAPYSAENGGMAPGLGNPLGARALYIFQGNVDTLYRLHGTNEPASIGKAVSSGCVRLINQDVIDLYDRVRSGSSIVVT